MKQNTRSKFHVTMTKTGPMNFEAKLDRDHYPLLSFDESPHAGGNDEAPDASRYLVSAILNCLSASLTFCLQKSRIPLDALDSEAICTIARNEEGYWRIQQIDIKLHPKWNDWSNEMQKALERCRTIFINYCVVSASVKEGVLVNVDVRRD
ncbi:MAG: OsmC family protein [Candidatus Heimdallarchaeota archaeon]